MKSQLNDITKTILFLGTAGGAAPQAWAEASTTLSTAWLTPEISIGSLGVLVIALLIAASLCRTRAKQPVLPLLPPRPQHDEQVDPQITALKATLTELTDAKTTAAAVSQRIIRLLSGMSHDLRTPLNGIFGMSELLLDTDLKPEQREFTEAVLTSAESLMKMLDDVLDYAKLEANQLRFENANFGLRDHLALAIKPLATSARARQLELTIGIDPNVPNALVGDAGRLRQVVASLMAHAIDSTKQGEVALQVQCLYVADGHGILHFSVITSGVIAEAVAPGGRDPLDHEAHIHQADLRKALAKLLLSRMGSQLEMGQSTKQGLSFDFTISFPLSRQLETKPSLAAPPQQAAGPTPKGLKVLVIDDNPTSRRILVENLSHWQMQSTCASGGKEALELLAKAHADGQVFDVAIIDILMPGMDGFAVASVIRQNPAWRLDKIILITAAVDSYSAERVESLGFAGFLTKPYIASELLMTLKKATASEPARTTETAAKDLKDLAA